MQAAARPKTSAMAQSPRPQSQGHFAPLFVADVNEPLHRTHEERLLRAQILKINSMMRKRHEVDFAYWVRQRLGSASAAAAYMEDQGLTKRGGAPARKGKHRSSSARRTRPLSARPLNEAELNAAARPNEEL